MGLGMAVVSTVHEQEELVSFLEHFTKEDSSIQGGEVPFYIGLTRQQGFFTIISSRTQRTLSTMKIKKAGNPPRESRVSQ